MKLKCSRQGCEEEGIYRTGTLQKAKVWCIKHYIERIRKQPDIKGSTSWENNL